MLPGLAIENYRIPGSSECQFEQQTLQAEKQLELLKKAANESNEDAIWVVEKLAID